MASSNQERTNSQTEPPSPPSSPPSTTHSSEKHPDPTSPPPPTTTHPTHPPPYPPPHPMYYPQSGYPTGPNPNSYPYPQNYNLYPNTYPPGYHYPPTTPYYDPSQTSTAGTRFIRSFILCSCVLLTCFFLFSLIIALTLRPELPVYKVQSLSVTNFTTTPTLGGNWNTKITVENPNDKLVAYFSDFKVDVAYKDGIVGVNYAPGFVLNAKDKRDISVTGSSSKANGDMMEKTTMEDLVKERGTGSVTFDLTVYSASRFKFGSFSTRSSNIVAICERLKVVFQSNNNATGNLDNGGKPIECQLYV